MELLNFKIQIKEDMNFKIHKKVVVSLINRITMKEELKKNMAEGVHIIERIHMQVGIDIKGEHINFKIHLVKRILQEHKNLDLIRKDLPVVHHSLD